MDDLGAKFWLSVAGVALAIGIGGILLFTLLGFAWYAWGAFGALLFAAVILIGAGYLWDRKHAAGYQDPDDVSLLTPPRG
jgi:hypothetical protein